MNKNALVIAGLTLMSTSAFASKARVEALGNNAIYYLSDKREVFLNPAAINANKNYIVAELGHSNVAEDTIEKPRAEGGFFREVGSLSYGLYLGNNENSEDRVKATATPKTFLSQDNAIDLFFGGDAGVQWGARLHYANAKDETTNAAEKRTNSAFGFGLGAIVGAAEVYTNVSISDKSEGDGTAANNVVKYKPSFSVGASYDWAGNTFFAEFGSAKAEITNTGVTSEAKATNILAGVGRQLEINSTSRAFGNVAFNMNKEEDGDKDTETTIPVAIGFEADATSWLTLRGSIGQNFVLNDKKVETAGTTTKSTNANTTEVNAGLSVNVGKMNIDGSIGQITGSNNSDRLISRVGVVYNF